MDYKIVVHDAVGHRTVAIDAKTYEEAAKRYFAEFTVPHYTDQWGTEHWDITVMGIKFHKTHSADAGVQVVRVTPQPPVLKHMKIIAPVWRLEEQT